MITRSLMHLSLLIGLANPRRESLMRWLKFNAVSAAGLVVQAGSLGFLVHVFGLHYLLATFVAVEAAVLHNFVWHRKWTWADRQGAESAAAGSTLLRFNLTNGMVSMAGNIFFMRLLVGGGMLEPVAANLLSILCCSLVNFLLSDRFVFISPHSLRPRR
ncbi:MAG: GtrA family protein [Acidobacteria bacterium]|nr:GtrA family protein [Acidobacteriota bacterium]